MKIGEFFEKHVQWIAVGLGCLWLLWVGWTYGINRPHVEINNQTLSAANVDEHIRDNDMNALTMKLNVQTVPTGLVDVPDFTDAFVSAMNGQNLGQLPFVVNSPPPYQLIGQEGPVPQKGPRFAVSKWPGVATPTDVAVGSGRSQVIQPSEKPAILKPLVNAANANAANANAANGNAAATEPASTGRPNIFNNNPEPQPQPAAAAAAAPLPGQPAGTPKDTPWVSVFAKLNFNEQDREFTKVNMPSFLMQKQYIEVQLQRQEVLPGGALGTIETVAGLPMNQPPVDRKNAAEFIKWSADAEAQKYILAPPFYFVVKGTAWEIPRKDVPAVAQAQAVEFNLQTKYQEWKQLKGKAEQDKFIAEMTPEQRKLFHDYRIAEERKEAAAKAPPVNNQRQPTNRGYTPGGPGGGRTLPGGGAGRPPAREGNFDAVDPALLREMYADSDQTIQQQRRRTMPDDPYGAYLRRRDVRRPMYEGEYMQPMQPQNQQILVNLIPDAQGNVDIWAHDETARPGLTYRYRLRAVIKNPLYDTRNIATDPKLAQAPYLPADLATGQLDPNAAWSDWSKPVAIPTNVDMMLVAAQSVNGREFARFRVKRFQEGQVNEAPKPFEVAPGDMIGGPAKVNVAPNPANAGGNVGVPAKQIEVDFTTAWTLVDIRPRGSDYQVRIMDSQGRMETRTVVGDRNRFKEEPAKAVGAVGLK